MSSRGSRWNNEKKRHYLDAENPDLAKKVRNILLKLANNQPALLARLESDTFRIYSSYKRGGGNIKWRRLSTDRTKGIKVLQSLFKQAAKLRDGLQSLPLNLKIEMDGDTSAYLKQITCLLADIEKAKAFQPTRKGTPPKFDATGVEYTAARIYAEYTGHVATLTHDPVEVRDHGDYVTFVATLFDAMKIEAKPASVIRARLAKQRMAKKRTN